MEEERGSLGEVSCSMFEEEDDMEVDELAGVVL